MKLISCNDKNEMSAEAARIVTTLVRRKSDAVLGLATGGTPEVMYQMLINDHQKNKTSYRHIRTVNLDEYVGLPVADRNSYHAYMNEHLFNHIDLPENQRFLPNGNAASIDEACRHYDRLIDKLGGIDLQILGIGRNGHIGFNEPGTPFDIGTHVVTLTESTRQANARYFDHIDQVPKQALTMGIGTILKSRTILLLACGASKADAIGRLLHCTKSDPDFPASALVGHPDVTVIADASALSAVEKAGNV
ncbi:MAG: glucosamine-6-phosphate deaminase [Sporolactobacillus sp.]|jgi:glucosamine-6-phosphate deaminase|nr:glucosamine-6-phosphate deaminase [Sporolactobacillus sp.]